MIFGVSAVLTYTNDIFCSKVMYHCVHYFISPTVTTRKHLSVGDMFVEFLPMLTELYTENSHGNEVTVGRYQLRGQDFWDDLIQFTDWYSDFKLTVTRITVSEQATR